MKYIELIHGCAHEHVQGYLDRQINLRPGAVGLWVPALWIETCLDCMEVVEIRPASSKSPVS